MDQYRSTDHPLPDDEGLLAELHWEQAFSALRRPRFTVEGGALDGRVLIADPDPNVSFSVFADRDTWERLTRLELGAPLLDRGWFDVSPTWDGDTAWMVSLFEGDDETVIDRPVEEATLAARLLYAAWKAHGPRANDFATRTEVELPGGTVVLHGDPDAATGTTSVTRHRALDMLARQPAPCPAGVTVAHALTLLGVELLALDERGRPPADPLLPARMRALWNVATMERAGSEAWPTGAEAAVGLAATPADERFQAAVLTWPGAPCLIEEIEFLQDDEARFVRVTSAPMDQPRLLDRMAPLGARWLDPDRDPHKQINPKTRAWLWADWLSYASAALRSLDAVGEAAPAMPQQLYAIADLVTEKAGVLLSHATTEQLRAVLFGPWVDQALDPELALETLGALSMVLREGDLATGGTAERAAAVQSWMEPILRRLHGEPDEEPADGLTLAERRKRERAARKKKRKQRKK